MTDLARIESSVRQTFASVVWSHKIQEKQADIYTDSFHLLEILRIAAASLTSAGIVSIIFYDELWIKIASALISFVTIFISSFFKTFDLRTMISKHKGTANKLLSIRDDLHILLLQIKLRKDDPSVLIENYKDLMNQLHKIYDEAPSTTDKAVKKARKALHIDNDNTFTETEIDSFLPKGFNG